MYVLFSQKISISNFLQLISRLFTVIQDEARVNCTVDKVFPINYEKEIKRLADKIEVMMI